jgi:hypothetical protein
MNIVYYSNTIQTGRAMATKVRHGGQTDTDTYATAYY